MKLLRQSLCVLASLSLFLAITGCESTDGGSVSGGVYYGVGFYDPWYYGGYYYDDPDIVVTPPDRPDQPVKPEHPIVVPPTPKPTPMPSIPSAPRPMPRGRAR